MSTAFMNAGQHEQELQVVLGIVAGIQQVLTQIGADGPVVVLTGAVDPCIGLLVQQADQTVAGGHPLHGLHSQLVLVDGHVGTWR